MSCSWVDCEQSLFFFRFSKGSAHARALSGEAARREKRGRPRLAPSVTRVVICVSREFCSTDQEKRETARSLNDSLIYHDDIKIVHIGEKKETFIKHSDNIMIIKKVEFDRPGERSPE